MARCAEMEKHALEKLGNIIVAATIDAEGADYVERFSRQLAKDKITAGKDEGTAAQGRTEKMGGRPQSKRNGNIAWNGSQCNESVAWHEPQHVESMGWHGTQHVESMGWHEPQHVEGMGWHGAQCNGSMAWHEPQCFESGRIAAADAERIGYQKWEPMQFPRNRKRKTGRERQGFFPYMGGEAGIEMQAYAKNTVPFQNLAEGRKLEVGV